MAARSLGGRRNVGFRARPHDSFVGDDADAAADEQRVDRRLDDVRDLLARDFVDARDERHLPHEQPIGAITRQVQRTLPASRMSIHTRATDGGSSERSLTIWRASTPGDGRESDAHLQPSEELGQPRSRARASCRPAATILIST